MEVLPSILKFLIFKSDLHSYLSLFFLFHHMQGVDTDQALHIFAEEIESLCEVNNKEEDQKVNCPIQFAFHLEPYEGRNVGHIQMDVEYLNIEFGHLHSLLKLPRRYKRSEEAIKRSKTSHNQHQEESSIVNIENVGGGIEYAITNPLPVFFVYDSYHIIHWDWKSILGHLF